MRHSAEAGRAGSERDERTNLGLHLKALDVGLWDYDIDTGGLTCDARWHDLIGAPEGTVNSLSDFRPFIHPEDVEFATSMDADMVVEMIALDQRYHIDFRIVRPDGEIRWLRSVACLLVDSRTGHRRAIGCVTDTTDQHLPADRPLTSATAADRDPSHDGEEAEDTQLSGKELECLSWVSLGKTAWETAIIMDRSQRTIEFHLTNAVRKLDATNKVHAAVIAIRRGLI